MDSYTVEEKAFVEQRFSDSVDGVYRAHQPIYGYKKWPCEWYFTGRYIPTLRIMKELSRLQCESMLDVGGAEGYKSYIANKLFGLKVHTSDLSEEACKRAREIFGLEATSLDIHDLPFADGQFDVLTCSETLEHVTEPREAIDELLRVAKKAVIITVPVEDPEHLRERYEKNNHINAFDVDSFDYLRDRGSHGHGQEVLEQADPLLRRVARELRPSGILQGEKVPEVRLRLVQRRQPSAGRPARRVDDGQTGRGR